MKKPVSKPASKKEHYEKIEHHEKSLASFANIITIIGAVLIGIGIMWVIGSNWHVIPAAIKIILLVLATGAAYASGVILKMKEYLGVSKAMMLLGSLFYTASIFLIAQIFSTSTGMQGIAYLFLLAWVGVMFASYFFDSPLSLILALIEFLVYIVLQYSVLIEHQSSSRLLAPIVFLFLFAGILIYGLGLIHRVIKHSFSKIYVWWSFFYFLIFASILTSRSILQTISSWPSLIESTGPFIFVLVIALIAVFLCGFGIALALKRNRVNPKEIYGIGLFIGLFLLLILLTPLIENDSSSFYNTSMDAMTMVLWLFSNVIFILLILAIIGYGIWMKVPGLINLGIIFFVVDVIARYVGFISYFRGYLSMSIIFIFGGALLLLGGLFIEKWRRKLIAKAEASKSQNTFA